jgi:calcium channel MID1
VIFDLEFCSDVAYAVPSSPKFKLNTTDLAKLYDDQAQAYYQNFTNSLAQVACDTTDTAQYSLARNCTDCSRDYKEWLCAVIMPRCEDFTAPASNTWLRERNINAKFLDGSIPYANNLTEEFNETMRDRFAYSKSRNPLIDDQIQPGPYKELLPCEDLCFDIVRSCPAQLQFACPNEPARGLMYGRRDPQAPDVLKCNFPGAVISLNTIRNGASGMVARLGTAVSVAVLVGAVLGF